LRTQNRKEKRTAKMRRRGGSGGCRRVVSWRLDDGTGWAAKVSDGQMTEEQRGLVGPLLLGLADGREQRADGGALVTATARW
jgi:hypothetical protein